MMEKLAVWTRGLARAGCAVAALIVLSGSPLPARAAPLEYLPLDHPAYRDLENLWTRCAIDSLDLAARPWSRHEVAEALHEISQRRRLLLEDPVFRRMMREFAREVSELDEDAPYWETPPLVQLEGVESALRVLPGVAFSATGDGPGKLGFDPGSRGFVQLEWFGSPDFYATTEIRAQRVREDRLVDDALVKDTNVLVDTEEAYLSYSTRYVDLLIGLTETRWGPGRSGTLLLSDAASPLATFRIQGTVAGRLDVHAVTAALSQANNRYLAAHRATFHVSRDLSIGISESARYDAESPGFLYVMSVIPYTVVHKIQARNQEGPASIQTKNNVMMGADINWRVYPGWRLFAELLVDDLVTESDGKPNRMALQVGVDRAAVWRGWPVSVLVEGTKVLRYTYATEYERNYILDGDPLGYELGPDTERILLAATVDPSMNWSFDLEMNFVRRGQGALGEFWDSNDRDKLWGTILLDGPMERTLDLTVGTRWIPRDEIWADVSAGYRWERDAVTGDGNREDRGDWMTGMGLHWRF